MVVLFVSGAGLNHANGYYGCFKTELDIQPICSYFFGKECCVARPHSHLVYVKIDKNGEPYTHYVSKYESTCVRLHSSSFRDIKWDLSWSEIEWCEALHPAAYTNTTSSDDVPETNWETHCRESPAPTIQRIAPDPKFNELPTFFNKYFSLQGNW